MKQCEQRQKKLKGQLQKNVKIIMQILKDVNKYKSIVNQKDLAYHSLAHQFRQLKIQFSRLQSLQPRILEYQQQVLQLQNTIQNLYQKQRMSQEITRQSKLTEELHYYKQNYNFVNNQLSVLKNDYHGLKTINEKLNNQFQKLQKKNEELQTKLNRYRINSEKYCMQNIQLKKNVDKMSGEYQINQILKNQSKIKIDTLNQKVKQLKIICADYQKDKQLIKQLNHDLQLSKEQAKKSTSKLQTANKILDKLQKQNFNLRKGMKEDHQKMKQVKLQMINAQKQLAQTLKCTLCKQQIKQPVTIIPCGHCFCLQCKTGYLKQCVQCGSNSTIDSLYRNQLLDDLINMSQLIAQSIIRINQLK